MQVLSRAADTIMLCALDEMANDGHKIRHASESLKTQIRGYVVLMHVGCAFDATLSTDTTINPHARITMGVVVVPIRACTFYVGLFMLDVSFT